MGRTPTFKPLLAATIPRPPDRGAPILKFQICSQFSICCTYKLQINNMLIHNGSSIRRHIFEKYSWQVTVCTDDRLTRNQIRDIMYPTLSIKGTARGLIRARSDFCITAVFRLIVPLTAYEHLSEPAIWSEHVCQSRSGN